MLERGKIYFTPLAFFTVHSGLDFDRWADVNKPIFISSNLHPLGKYQYRDIEWTNGFKRNFWDPKPPKKIKFWLRAFVTGFGYVEFSDFKVKVYGQTFAEVTKQDKVGYYIPIVPNYNLVENYEVYQHLEGPKFRTASAPYNWTASGKVKLIPVHYALGGCVGGGPSANFGWTKDTSLAPTEYSQSGSWVVEHRIFKNPKLTGTHRCAGCSEKVSSKYAHRIACANPQDNTQYYFCLQTEKWTHLYEETCSNVNCADTGVYRCAHTHSEPSPPSPDPNPPDIAGSCGHRFPTTQIASHEPSVGSCGHTYSPCTPDDHKHSTYACGTHSGYLCQASSDHSSTISGYSGSFYECQSHQTYSCGHKDLNSNSSSHALQASCSGTDSYGQTCTVTSFYACQSHTHQYPALISGACGHSYTSAQTYNHRSETCPTNSNGDNCSSGSYTIFINYSIITGC